MLKLTSGRAKVWSSISANLSAAWLSLIVVAPAFKANDYFSLLKIISFAVGSALLAEKLEEVSAKNE